MSEEPSDFTYSQKSLEEGAYAEGDSITIWPEGSSVMAATAGANWGPNTGEAGIVTTKSAGTEGVQTFEAYNGSTYKRAYTDDAWSEWVEVAEVLSAPNPRLVLTRDEDEWAETLSPDSDPFVPYDALYLIPVSAAANWGPNTGEAGMVLYEQQWPDAVETFTQYSNGHKFSRGYTSGAWSAWVALQ